MALTTEQAREMGKKAKRGKRISLRSAIDKMCRACIYDSIGGNGTWRQQTEGCGDTSCPLHEARPLSSGDGDANE